MLHNVGDKDNIERSHNQCILKFVRVTFGVDGKTVKIRKDSIIKEIDDMMAEFLLPD